MNKLPRDTVATHGGYGIFRLTRPYPTQQLKPNGLSVIMPTFNKRESIGRAISSICDQEPCMPVEIIVVDDGSTDGTFQRFEGPWSVCKTCPDWMDIKYIQTGVPKWTSPANSYNLGFENAKYNYMVHSGADIVWAKPTMLKAIQGACDIDRYLIFDYYVLNSPFPDKPNFELIDVSDKGRTTLYPWCIVTSAEALKRIGFYEKNYRAGAGEDDAMIVKMSTIGITFCRVDGQAVVNQEHEKEYVRDLQWKANTEFNVRLGWQASANLRRKMQQGELKRF